jgi:hypothetical protein
MTTKLDWKIEQAGDGSLLKATATPSPSVSYEIFPVNDPAVILRGGVSDQFHVNRLIKQGGGNFGWPLETAAMNLDIAMASAQTDWDGIHG